MVLDHSQLIIGITEGGFFDGWQGVHPRECVRP
jgi:hypothetical protein